MRIFITGMNGFLGSHLAEALVAEHHNVMGNDNDICSSTKSKNCAKADCRDFSVIQGMLESFRPDVLFHCAATAHEGLSNFSPSFITKNIYEASITTFSAAIAAGVKRIVFMSSMARYGQQTLPFHEAMTPHPVDPYGIAKVAAEDTLKALCKLHHVEYVIAVPHNIIGSRQRYNDPYRNVCSIMINRALQGKPIIIYGDGKQKRCFSPIKDCLHSLVKMIDAPISGETINIGPDHGEMTIRDLAELVRGACWKHVANIEIQHLPDRPNEVKEAWCTSKKARQLLAFKPQEPLNVCITEMVKHIHENGTRSFSYSFPVEITEGCPVVWTEKLM